MTVLVLGSTGMLGHAVSEELLWRGHDVVRASRTNNVRFDVNEFLTDPSTLPGADWVINCIGSIKQRCNDPMTLFNINSWFPNALHHECLSRGSKLIHVTTDCVFSGRRSMPASYDERDKHDVDDDYGRSKSLGEPNCMVLRTSLVGLELEGRAHSLLEWARSMKGQRVDGYTNHFWNGVTNVQFGKICDMIIRNDMFERGVKHVFSPRTVSKRQLLSMFDERFGLNLDILSVEHDKPVNRSLSTIYDLNSTLMIPDINDQLKSL